MKKDNPESSIKIFDGDKERLRDILGRLEIEPDKLIKIFPTLSFSEQLGLLLLTSGLARKKLILSSPYAKQLTQMLPEQEIYISLKEVGFADALPIFSLLSPEQIQYLNDLEVWEKDDFNAPHSLELFKIILQCGEEKSAEWLKTVDPEILVLTLQEYGWVTKFDVTNEEMDEADQPPHFSFDGFYRFHPREDKFRPILESIVRILQDRHPDQYGMIMESVYQDSHAEIQEEALRFRSSRLSEKGIPDFDHACEIYIPLSDEQFQKTAVEIPAAEKTKQLPTALYPLRWLPADSLLHRALRTLTDHPETDRIRLELATIGNKILVADGMEPKDLEALKYSLKKSAGFLSIALEYLTGNNTEQAASWLTKTWMHFLFRLGYNQIYKLVKKAHSLQNKTRFKWIDKYLYLADSPLEETMRGLLRSRPLFYEGQNEKDSFGFREFRDMKDIGITAERLAVIEALANLFIEDLSLPPERIKTICQAGGLADQLDIIKWSQILQTIWAQQTLTGEPKFQILSSADVQAFLKIAFEVDSDGGSKTLSPHFRQTLTNWTLERMDTLNPSTQKFIEGEIIYSTSQLEEELAGIDSDQPVDGRFIKGLCVISSPL